jgi:hypothetical protein
MIYKATGLPSEAERLCSSAICEPSKLSGCSSKLRNGTSSTPGTGPALGKRDVLKDERPIMAG